MSSFRPLVTPLFALALAAPSLAQVIQKRLRIRRLRSRQFVLQGNLE